MSKLIVWCRDHSIVVIVFTILVSAFFGYHIKDIKIDVSAEGMMIEDDPDLDYYHEILEVFGTDDVTAIFIKDKDLFTFDKLEQIREVAYKLEDLPNIERVESLFTTTNFDGRSGFLETLPVLDWTPEEKEELEQAKEAALRSPLLYLNLISKDGNALILNAMVKPDKSDPDFNIKITNQIQEIIDPLKGSVDQVFQIGKSYTRKSLGDSIIGDMTHLIPLSVLVLLIMLVLSLRTINGAIMPSLTGGISLLWTFGFMAMMGIPLNVVTVIVPSLILVIGATEDMHMISEYFEGLEEGEGKLNAIKFLANKVGLAIFLTSMTTYLGFLSIIVNKITLLRQFGMGASFGLIANFIITFSVTPVYLKYFGEQQVPGKHKKEQNTEHKDLFQKVADVIIKVIASNKKKLLSGMIIIGVVFGCGTALIKVDNDFLGYFKKSSDIRVRSDILHEEASGSQNFYLVFDGKTEGAFKQPENLQKLFMIQRYMDKTGKFDKTISIADYIALVNREMEEGNNEMYIIPNSADLVSQYLLMFARNDVDRYVSADFSKANISVRHNLSSSYDLSVALDGLRKYIDGIVGDNMTYAITGENILVNKAADTMALGQALSLSLILVIIFIIMSVLFLRIKAGLLSLIPNLFPIAIVFGIMGFFDIPLNTGTAMIAAIAIGIAVDDTIHLMVRYNNAMKESNDQDVAMVQSIKSEIRPVLSTSVSLALGFVILSVSNFTPIIYFGVLSAITMIMALAGDVILTPILLSTTKLVTLWDMLQLDLKARVITESPLFKSMRPWQIKKIVLLAHVKEYQKDNPLILKGEKGRSMFLLLDGTLRVMGEDENKHTVTFQILHPGDIVGEIALVSEVERTANVYATEDSKVLEIDWDALERIRKIFPNISAKLFLNISRVLGTRLVDTSNQLILMTEKAASVS